MIPALLLGRRRMRREEHGAENEQATDEGFHAPSFPAPSRIRLSQASNRGRRHCHEYCPPLPLKP